MSKKFSIGFILYNPSGISISRIINTTNSGYNIIVLLNSVLEECVISNLKSHKSIQLIEYKANEGLSKGLSLLCNAAYHNGSKAILYFDQDTIFSSDTLDFINGYYNCVRKIGDKFTESIICTTFRDSTIINKKFNHIATVKVFDYIIENVYFTINSGSLYFLENINSFDCFDNRYFVDGVDYSFCINSIRNNFIITEIFNTPGLDHKSEQNASVIKIFNKELSGRVDPFSRNYDFIKSHLKLLFKSFYLNSVGPQIFILRSIFIYIIVQILFRVTKKLHNSPNIIQDKIKLFNL